MQKKSHLEYKLLSKLDVISDDENDDKEVQKRNLFVPTSYEVYSDEEDNKETLKQQITEQVNQLNREVKHALSLLKPETVEKFFPDVMKNTNAGQLRELADANQHKIDAEVNTIFEKFVMLAEKGRYYITMTWYEVKEFRDKGEFDLTNADLYPKLEAKGLVITHSDYEISFSWK